MDRSWSRCVRERCVAAVFESVASYVTSGLAFEFVGYAVGVDRHVAFRGLSGSNMQYDLASE